MNTKYLQSKASYWSSLWLGPFSFAVVALILFGPFLLWLPLGILAYSFIEYATHRWVLHGFITGAHNAHHDHPSAFIRAPWWAVLVEVQLVILAVLAGWWAVLFVLGMALGSGLNFIIHSACHYTRPFKAHPLHGPWKRHSVHHADPAVNYGVITSLWDRLFKTEATPNVHP